MSKRAREGKRKRERGAFSPDHVVVGKHREAAVGPAVAGAVRGEHGAVAVHHLLHAQGDGRLGPAGKEELALHIADLAELIKRMRT